MLWQRVFLREPRDLDRKLAAGGDARLPAQWGWRVGLRVCCAIRFLAFTFPLQFSQPDFNYLGRAENANSKRRKPQPPVGDHPRAIGPVDARAKMVGERIVPEDRPTIRKTDLSAVTMAAQINIGAQR